MKRKSYFTPKICFTDYKSQDVLNDSIFLLDEDSALGLLEIYE